MIEDFHPYFWIQFCTATGALPVVCTGQDDLFIEYAPKWGGKHGFQLYNSECHNDIYRIEDLDSKLLFGLAFMTLEAALGRCGRKRFDIPVRIDDGYEYPEKPAFELFIDAMVSELRSRGFNVGELAN